MRFLSAITAMIIGFGLVTVSQTIAHGAKAQGASSFQKRNAKRHRQSRRRQTRRRRFTQREIDRLPVSVTRPPNSARLQFQGYPLWAAEAFQPRRNGGR